MRLFKGLAAVGIVTVGMAGGNAHGGGLLFSFEQDLAPWVVPTPKETTITPATRFATDGKRSMLLTTQKWVQGMPEWPGLVAPKFPIRDWSGYDRLMIDLVNPTPVQSSWAAFCTDSKVPWLEGKLVDGLIMNPYEYKRVIIPLTQINPKIDKRNICFFNLATGYARGDYKLYLDNMRLLKAGEKEPAVPASFLTELDDLWNPLMSEAENTLNKWGDTQTSARSKCLLQYIRGRNAVLIPRAQNRSLSYEERRQTVCAILNNVRLLQRLDSIKPYSSNEVLIGSVDGMTRVFPEFEALPKLNLVVTMSAAKRERESVQVVIMPLKEELKAVSVKIDDLTGDAGVLSAANFLIAPVGFVELKKASPWPIVTDGFGWYPDPILTTTKAVDIRFFDSQPFWLALKVPKDQAAGAYSGTITVLSSGRAIGRLPITVTVRNFTMPGHSPFPILISTRFPCDSDEGNVKPGYDGLTKEAYTNLLGEYYINFDTLYNFSTVSWEEVERMRARGELVGFNLQHILYHPDLADDEAAIKKELERARGQYDEAKARNLLDYAYFYGYDEQSADKFPRLGKVAKRFKKEFPNIPILTTALDLTYGLDAAAPAVDVWCPLTKDYDLAKADAARARGAKVWWYTFFNVPNTQVGLNLENVPVDARLLMGAMVVKFRPDGFLYYTSNFWGIRKPVQLLHGAYTDWEPETLLGYHLDGLLFYRGPNNVPMPSIRLENIRDGLEDLAYWQLLKAIVTDQKKRQGTNKNRQDWLKRATAALVLPNAVVASKENYDHTGQDVIKWRTRLADLIEESKGADQVRPWGRIFNVLGAHD